MADGTRSVVGALADGTRSVPATLLTAHGVCLLLLGFVLRRIHILLVCVNLMAVFAGDWPAIRFEPSWEFRL